MDLSGLDKNTRNIIAAVADRVTRHGDPSRSVIDLGCGHGWLLQTLQARGCKNLCGAGMQVNLGPSIPAFAGVDLCRAGWAQACGGGYRFVIATEVIEHLTNPYLFLREARTLLAVDGELVLTFPNVHNFRSIVGYALTGRYSGFFGPNFNDGHPLFDQHIFIPNIHLIRYFMQVTGLSVRHVEYVGGHHRLFAPTTLLVATAS